MAWQIKTKGGQIYGPIDLGTLVKLVEEKKISDEDFVWMEDKKEWVIIKSVPEMESFLKGGPPPEIKQEVAEVKASQEKKDFGDTLQDDKNILTIQLIADAWRAMLAKGIWSILGALALMGLVMFSASSLLGFIPVINMFSSLVLQAAFTLGWSAYTLKVARKEEMGVGSIFEGFKGKYIWCALGAMLLIGIFTTLAGIITLGIWGFYLTLAYLLTYLFIFDENRGPWEAMKASFDITKGYKWRIMAVQIICALLGMLFLGIGLLVTIPLSHIAIASLYYRIRTGRISERHLQTSAAEYLIVLIPFILAVVFIVIVFSAVLMKQAPLFLEQMEGYLKNLPR